MDDTVFKQRVEQMVDFIMKNCLWQFHSRAWDRERQNREILTKAMQILCDEPVSKATAEERCYWVDSIYLAESYRKRFSWLADIGKADIKRLMQGVRERMDFLTFKGSLNLELNDQHY